MLTPAVVDVINAEGGAGGGGGTASFPAHFSSQARETQVQDSYPSGEALGGQRRLESSLTLLSICRG